MSLPSILFMSEMAGEFGDDFSETESDGAGFGFDSDCGILRPQSFVGTKELTQQPFEAIPADGIANATRYSQAELCRPLRQAQLINSEIGGLRALPAPEGLTDQVLVS